MSSNGSSFHLNWMENNMTSNNNNDMSNTLEGNMSENAMIYEKTSGESNVGNASERTTLSSMAVTQHWDTLDEPIIDTLVRDLRGICLKLKYIIFPLSSQQTYKNVLKNWDLWGPLILCTFMAFTLHHNEHQTNSTTVGPHFAEIFVLIWFGTVLLSINYKLLSSSSRKRVLSDKSSVLFSSPSTFQLLCVFGYCLAPPSVGIIVLNLLSSVLKLEMRLLFYEKLLIGVVFGFIWPTLSSMKILAKYQEKDKRLLALYPIGLFYFVLSWAIISSH